MPLKALVGKRQEIYLPREVRKALGIKPGDRLVATIKGDGEIVLKRVASPLELLKKKAGGSITLKEDIAMRREISRALEA
jgi:AbrB family looped-hinge helix DNA binding protein